MISHAMLGMALRTTTSFALNAARTASTLELSSRDLAGAAELIRDGARCVVMLGAGCSASAGIPDFRTPGTGLYDNLERYGLPYPEAIFELDFFRDNPWPFYELSRSLWPGGHAPTPMHLLLKLLHDRDRLVRCYTQNIDSLETAAGLPPSAVIAAHGNFDGARCVDTGESVDVAELRQALFADDSRAALTALNEEHGGLVKSEIVFFGEALPRRFFESFETDLARADLLIVAGTSLVVNPFASLIDVVRDSTPRLLINRERVGENQRNCFYPDFYGFDFATNATLPRDIFHQCTHIKRLSSWSLLLIKNEAFFASMKRTRPAFKRVPEPSVLSLSPPGGAPARDCAAPHCPHRRHRRQ